MDGSKNAKVTEDRVDVLCRCSPDWDIRFSRCPLRLDYGVRKCRILYRAVNLLPPKYCYVERHTGPATLREIGVHIEEYVPFTRGAQWVGNTEPVTLSDGVSNENKESWTENIFD